MTIVTVGIYDVRGKLVRTLKVGGQPAGVYLGREQAIYWDGRDNAIPLLKRIAMRRKPYHKKQASANNLSLPASGSESEGDTVRHASETILNLIGQLSLPTLDSLELRQIINSQQTREVRELMLMLDM